MNTWKGLNIVSDPLIQSLFLIRVDRSPFQLDNKQSNQIRVERKPFIAGGWDVWPDESEPRRCAAQFWFSGQTPTPRPWISYSDSTSASISEKVNISWGQRQRSVDAILTCVDLHVLVSRSINMLCVTDFVPKGIHFRGQSSSRPLFGHAGCWSIAKCSQCSCRNFTGRFRSWLPATCSLSTRWSFDHHGKGNGNFV